jgi:hypothetical protein
VRVRSVALSGWRVGEGRTRKAGDPGPARLVSRLPFSKGGGPRRGARRSWACCPMVIHDAGHVPRVTSDTAPASPASRKARRSTSSTELRTNLLGSPLFEPLLHTDQQLPCGSGPQALAPAGGAIRENDARVAVTFA